MGAMSRLISLRVLVASSAVVSLLMVGGAAFATNHTQTQGKPVMVGATPKCINDSRYTIQVPTDPKQKTEPKGTTNKPKPPSTTDKPGCYIKLCVPAALSKDPNAKNPVCTEKYFSSDEELKNARTDTQAGALDVFKGNVLKSLADLSKSDPTTFATLSDQIRTLPQGIQDAFKEHVSGEITTKQNAVNEAERRLRELQSNCLTDGPECAGVQDAQQELRLKQEELEKLNATKKILEDPNRTPVVPPPSNPQECPPGQVKVDGVCKTRTDTFPPSGPGTTGPGGTQSPSGGQNPFNSILSQLARALMGQQQPQQPTCPTDPQQYQQYQQMFQQQMQQYQFQLQQYNYQQQYAQYSNSYSPPPPVPPVQCKPATTGGGQCTNEPAQPQSACAAGWQPVRNSQQCITSWQCGGGSSGLAQISCQPQLADVGMTVGITFGCSAGTAVGQGFSTNGQNSGSTQATTTSPGAGINTINFGLTCTNQGVTDSKQCTVNLNRPSLIFVANPKVLNSGERSSIGWVTAGMQGCIISSPDHASFTSDHANNSRKSGVAETPTLTADSTFVLSCTTLAGGTRTASTTVDVR